MAERGAALRQSYMRDMANLLLVERGSPWFNRLAKTACIISLNALKSLIHVSCADTTTGALNAKIQILSSDGSKAFKTLSSNLESTKTIYITWMKRGLRWDWSLQLEWSLELNTLARKSLSSLAIVNGSLQLKVSTHLDIYPSDYWLIIGPFIFMGYLPRRPIAPLAFLLCRSLAPPLKE